MRSPIFSTLLFILVTRNPAFAFPVCHICPLGDHSMSRGGGTLNTVLKTYTCSEARKYGLNGELGDNSCKILQMYANADTSNPCGCKELEVYPVENNNPVCDVCPQRTVTVTINGKTYQEMSVYPPSTNKDVMTMLDRMPCGEILEMARDKWLPQGTCPQFQEDAKNGGCCKVDSIEEIEDSEENVVVTEATPPTPPPSITSIVQKAPLSKCAKGRETCSDSTDCCNGYFCKDFSCQVKGRPADHRKKESIVKMDNLPWDDRKLLRKAKHSKNMETHD